MSILTGPEIARVATSSHRLDGTPAIPFIEISHFDAARCGPNSYDVTLSPELRQYAPNDRRWSRTLNHVVDCLNPRLPLETYPLPIPEDGLLIEPGQFYLGAINEHIECHGLVPYIDGRSTIGRLSISVHETAGRGDDGYRGRLTLEITCALPVIVYPHMPIGQLTFHMIQGERQPYAGRYLDDDGPQGARPFAEVPK